MADSLVNLNFHVIRVECNNGSVFEFPSDGKALRFNTIDEIVDDYMGIQIVKRIYLDPEIGSIPKKKDGTYYILPNQITQLFTPHENAIHLNRTDFISPDTRRDTGARRSETGRVLAVQRFKTADEFLIKRSEASNIESAFGEEHGN